MKKLLGAFLSLLLLVGIMAYMFGKMPDGPTGLFKQMLGRTEGPKFTVDGEVNLDSQTGSIRSVRRQVEAKKQAVAEEFLPMAEQGVTVASLRMLSKTGGVLGQQMLPIPANGRFRVEVTLPPETEKLSVILDEKVVVERPLSVTERP